MNKEKKATAATVTTQTNLYEGYRGSSPRSIHLSRFLQSIKNKWVVKREDNGDEFIRLNGKKALEGLVDEVSKLF